MNFRNIHAEDYNICAKNLVLAYAGPPWHNKWTEQEALLRIEATMSGFNSRGYVIENEGEIIAMCIGRIDYYFSNFNQFFIDEFNVIPNQQGLGIGKKLMNFFKGEIKRENVNKIFLITGGESASKFYSNNKFEITNDGFMMELEL
ncbi:MULTISPECIES: GNAT family N-acetyltransferase [Mammaliicoccus]|uniref:N-acetyltransferase n=1 Tax=Mammaliicoccus vitulinus TaxID=71237 RepID=A0A2T4PS11_9STAP|nr:MULTISPECIES: GNAT family N-acetyltransferase [Mammaliicoccus]HAL08777.1 N-acetyltransferase [Staphylococcus sp.]MBO3076934.1 GNAT family N-acetyltransferase [Mammaliicoccus vitulinus]PTI29020.1 N-acetyltransferase [Mammaliicoccus vitulinus]PTI69162.1 N-acetyltransferase [Mammaliicoccus vitulinus]PTI82954.1 N-acetyltransferase [Mammaliicoccus vitulinus]